MDFFKLKQHNTNVKTEVTSGFTIFLAMLYIIPVNASIMSSAGMPFEALVTATALMTIIASILNGIFANTPIAMSVGMGLNAYFSFGLVKGMGIAWETALGIVFISGILYFFISITPLRRWMLEGIPIDIKRAVSAGIGAFIALIGLEQMHIIANSQSTLITLGDMHNPHVILAMVGLGITLFLTLRKIKGAFIIAIFLTTILAWVSGVEVYPKSFFSMPASIMPIAFKMDIVDAMKLSLVPVIITFLVTDVFDTLGTLTGVGLRANLFKDKEGSKSLQKTIEADAAATALSAFAGVTSTTAFIESAAGVEEGGRTGLTAVATGVFFILPLFMLPFFKAIPPEAIYPVLVVVGALMFGEVKNINYEDKAVSFSAFFMIMGMPLTYSITDGLLLGVLVYSAVKIFTGKFREIGMSIGLLSILAILILFVL
jgi:AGZA family xanthine/uracil permease-like MFS transporter